MLAEPLQMIKRIPYCAAGAVKNDQKRIPYCAAGAVKNDQQGFPIVLQEPLRLIKKDSLLCCWTR